MARQIEVEVRDTRLFTIILTEDEVIGVIDALAYWDLAESGNNFQQGYPEADYEDIEVSAKAARNVMETLQRAVESEG